VIIEPRKGIAATDAALVRGEGAPVCKGRLVDIASIEQAEMIVRQAKMIAR
jgi:malyl-CoA/(S)-citramalyl-CoA lyase